MNDKKFLEASFPYFSMAFELIPERLHDDCPLNVHVTLADKLLHSVEAATGIRPPENMSGYKVANYYFETIAQ